MPLHVFPYTVLPNRGFKSIVQMEALVDVSAALVSLPSMTAPNCCSTFGCLPYFFGGILLLALVECVCVFFLIRRLLERKPAQNPSPSSLEYRSEGGSNYSSFSLQGTLWVAPLPEGDWSKAILQMPGKDKKREKEAERDGPKEGSNRVGTTKNVLKIAPVRKHVVLKEGILLLKEVDGNEGQISLEGCEVSSISYDQTSNGKWSKMFPIKLHHPTRTLYGDCKDCLFYAESGYEKEAWCEILQATATSDEWYIKLKKEFGEYTDVVEKRLPYLLNEFPSGNEANSMAAIRKEMKSDDFKDSEEGFSKRRLIFNKLLRRGRKTKQKSLNATRGLETSSRRINPISEGQEGSQKLKESVISHDHDDGNSTSHASHASIESITRSESTFSECDVEQSTSASTQEDKKEVDQVLAATLVHGHDNRTVPKEIDQGQVCLNMLVARLFFDLYHSKRPVDWLQHQLQRLISRMKTPSYVKSLIVREIDLGKEPPFVTAFRLLPADAEGALAIEVSLEWRSGGFITIETRVDVRDQNAQEKMASQLAGPGFEGAAASAVVRGAEEDLDPAGTAEASTTSTEARQAAAISKRGPGDDSSKGGGWMHSVKAVISRVADQVSQVPLLLKIRLISVKGTCIISLKAPPSDRIWFSFKDMPDIDMVPEPCIGDHLISNDLLGKFIANQIKTQIREHIVMPYRQDVRLHWMIADQVDWLPHSAFPVAFSAAKHSVNERQSSKFKLDEQSKLDEDNDGIGQSSTSSSQSVHSNGQNKLQVGQVSEASRSPHVGSVDGSPIAQAQPPPDLRSLGNLQASGTSRNQLQNSAISVQFSSEHSLPSRPPGSSVHSSATSSIRVDKESDLTRPLLDRDDQNKGKISASSSGFDAGASERAVGAVYIDVAPQSEDSASDSESQHPPNQFQVINQDHAKADLSKDLDSRVSRRTKMFTLGKKVGNKLDERRRSVLEKLREKRAEGSEAGSPRHSGRDLV